MQQLNDFKSTERTSCPAIKFLPMQLGNDEVTRRIALHHAKRVIDQHKEEIQNLANK